MTISDTGATAVAGANPRSGRSPAPAPESAPAIRVAIVDNDAITLHALSELLSRRFRSMTVIWSASNGREAIAQALAPTTSPDVLLVDMSLSDMSGIRVCREIRRRSANIRLLGITSFPLDIYARKASAAGAQGLVGKESMRALFDALGRVLATGVGLPQCGVNFEPAAQAHRRLREEPPRGVDALSPMELRVLQACAEGKSQECIAAEFDIASGTVRTHVKRIKAKLHAATLSQAVMLWLTMKDE